MSSSPISRFFLNSPKSIFNFISILCACLIFDYALANNNHLYNFVNENFYKSLIKRWASNPMFEPQIAVLSFMVACTIFSISKLFLTRTTTKKSPTQEEHELEPEALLDVKKSTSSSSSASVSNDNNKNTFSLLSNIINGDISSWAFWGISNVGLYLGLIDIFQRVTNYGGTLYRYNENWRAENTNEMFVSTRIFLEVFFSILGYDLIFSAVHRSFHSTSMPKWWQKLHLTHHDHYTKAGQPLHVMVTFHHHILDATIQIAINAAFQQIVTFSWTEQLPRHTVSKMLHNIIVTYLLVESHSGQDWFFMTHRWLAPEWFRGGAKSHQQHHNTGKAPFHQFFTIFDDF